MTLSLYAALTAAMCMAIGCCIGYALGRTDERKAWCGLVRGLYRNARGSDEFKIEMVAKAQGIEKDGWQQ